MSNTTQMPTKSTLRQDCLSAAKFFQSAALVILCHDSKEAFHSECSLLASLILFLVIILTNTSLQLVNFLSRRLFTTCKVIYAAVVGRNKSNLRWLIHSETEHAGSGSELILGCRPYSVCSRRYDDRGGIFANRKASKKASNEEKVCYGIEPQKHRNVARSSWQENDATANSARLIWGAQL